MTQSRSPTSITAPTVTPRTSRLWSRASTWWSETRRTPTKQTRVKTTMAVGRYRRRRSGTRHTATATVTAQAAATAPITQAWSDLRTSYQPPARARSRPMSVRISLTWLALPAAMTSKRAPVANQNVGHRLAAVSLRRCRSTKPSRSAVSPPSTYSETAQALESSQVNTIPKGYGGPGDRCES